MKQLRPITPITILAAELGEIITDNAKELSSKPEILRRLKRCKDLAGGLDHGFFLIGLASALSALEAGSLQGRIGAVFAEGVVSAIDKESSELMVARFCDT